MSVHIDPREVLTYFNNIVCPWRAKQLQPVSIAKSVCHLVIQINGHNSSYHCHCFSCRICRVLLSTLFARGEQENFACYKKSNYYNVSEEYIYQKLNFSFLGA